jgi:hypothetical protein
VPSVLQQHLWYAATCRHAALASLAPECATYKRLCNKIA